MARKRRRRGPGGGQQAGGQPQARRSQQGAQPAKGGRPVPATPKGAAPRVARPPQPSRGGEPSRRRRRGRGGPRRPVSLAARAEALLKNFPPEFPNLQEFLRTCKELQQALAQGKIETPTADELFYLFASGVETLAEDKLDRIFDIEYRDKFKSMREAAGKGERDYWDPEDPETPEEYRALFAEWRGRKRATLAAILREWGQEEAAHLILEDHEAYLRRRSEGRDRFVSHSPLAAFVTRVLSTPQEDEDEEEEEDGAESEEEEEDFSDEVEEEEGDEEDLDDEEEDPRD
ncbi:MAG: hypothetical protein GHCLOJNM_01351 [bacterium]|nr:hypothetical protein [bacterium]